MTASLQRIATALLAFAAGFAVIVIINNHIVERNRVMRQEVWIDAEIVGLPTPLGVLASAVHKDGLSGRIRVRWNETMGSGHIEGYLLYDRRRHSLTLTDSGEWEDLSGRSCYEFTGVGEETILALEDTTYTADDVITLLPREGCLMRKLYDINQIHKPQTAVLPTRFQPVAPTHNTTLEP